jgi:hypothetical protein
VAATIEDTAERVHRSDTVHGFARFGFASRGLLWLVVGLLALSVLLGGDQQTDPGGALRAIVDKPFGEVLLVALVVGFLGYSTWRLLSAAVGHQDEHGAHRSAHRVISSVDGLIHLALAVSTVHFLARGGGQDQTASRTAEVMAMTGGRTAVGLLGLVLVAVGVVLTVRAVRCDHRGNLERNRVPARLRRPAVAVGIAGLIGRGFVLALIGGFLALAAYREGPAQAKGLDAALQALAEQTYGQAMLLITVAGMIAYALWSFVEAACREL